MSKARVLDIRDRPLSPCAEGKARRLVEEDKADLVNEEPLTIRLHRAVDIPKPKEEINPVKGKRLLLHICCAPCATYTVKRLRALGAEVTGHWFNPNIHPYSEHERRRKTLARYAKEIALPVIWEKGYEMPAFFRAVVGHETFHKRCAICYHLRLQRTAQRAAEEGFDFFSTTLLISPYQDQDSLRKIGEACGRQRGVAFYFENFRRGFAEHYELARAHDLYMQRYCGCIYSEWEAKDKNASTQPHH
ncbi:MAG: epoxyqueuosine reductase QueH [Chloroflexota bacterium]|nr:epoxyqueuosine reductase QueH [Chloroflexota bacterium]